jgi:hypothetical protein
MSKQADYDRLNHIWAYIERWADNIPLQGGSDEGLGLTINNRHIMIVYNGNPLVRIDNGMNRNLHVVTKEVSAVAFALSNYCEAIA